jgi:RNA polymerase sigma-70 factor (ECF subfamily)
LQASEAELIRGAKSGDREAFCRLAQLYERRLFALALYYCRDAHDAEDLSQEVWLKAYRSIGNFRGESSFYTWLRRIAINTFLNDRRGVANQRAETSNESVSLEEMNEVVDLTNAGMEELLHRRQLVAQVRQAMAELTPQQRLIFLLKHEEEMSCEEIAQACEISTGTVKKALFRAVQKIRERLGIHKEEREGLVVTKAN